MVWGRFAAFWILHQVKSVQRRPHGAAYCQWRNVTEYIRSTCTGHSEHPHCSLWMQYVNMRPWNNMKNSDLKLKNQSKVMTWLQSPAGISVCMFTGRFLCECNWNILANLNFCLGLIYFGSILVFAQLSSLQLNVTRQRSQVSPGRTVAHHFTGNTRKHGGAPSNAPLTSLFVRFWMLHTSFFHWFLTEEIRGGLQERWKTTSINANWW